MAKLKLKHKSRGSQVLYLTDDATLVHDQLIGVSFTYTDQPLAFGVNTDAMINGGRCTEGYTPDVLGPYFLEGYRDVVPTDGIRSAGFQVIVGGDAYGSGSSREVAVVAHQGAGIELVIARSFQRIFQENMVYSGMPFTTDFGVIARLEAGEEIDTSEFTRDLPPFFQAVANAGGLLTYGEQLLTGSAQLSYSVDRPGTRLMTVIEKIVATNTYTDPDNHDGLAYVEPGDQVFCHVDTAGIHEYTAGMVVTAYREAFGDTPIYGGLQALAFEDHFVLIDEATVPLHAKRARLASSQALTREMIAGCAEYHIPVHGPGRDLDPGVCHRLMVERYATPGSVVILTDSHSPTAGVVNCLAFGVGSTAMTFALRTGLIPVTVPKTVRVVLTGQPQGGLTAKDVILHIIGDPYFREEHWRTSPTDTCIIQFGGEALDHFTVDELSVLTNMTVEGGLMTGVIEPCQVLRDFLLERRGSDMADEMVYPDPDAHYERVIKLDLSEIPLTVATPGDSRNRRPLDEVGHVPIHNVVVASCTGGSLADLRQFAAVLFGHSIKDGVRVTVTPSSADVAQAAEEEGLLERFRLLGAVVTPPGCGSCIGNGPGIPLPGETTASTTNRNFDKRMGAPGQVYLVSPAVAAACAVTGLLVDPRTLPTARGD